MSDFLEHKELKREHDSTDDFEHLDQPNLLDLSNPPVEYQRDGLGQHRDLLDSSVPASEECDLKPVPATPPPSADFEKFEGGAREVSSFGQTDELEARIREHLQDTKAATMAFVESEKSPYGIPKEFEVRSDDKRINYEEELSDEDTEPERSEPSMPSYVGPDKRENANLLDDDDIFAKEEKTEILFDTDDFLGEIKSSTLPEPEKSPELDFVKDEIIVHEATKEKPKDHSTELWFDEPPTKPLPPLPKEAEHDDYGKHKYQLSNDFLMAESKTKAQQSGGETGDSEFESEPEHSPAKSVPKPAPVKPELGDVAERKFYQKPDKVREIDEIAPKEIFRDIGLETKESIPEKCSDAWFNPERLNPKVAALIYWRDPKKSGIVFGATLIVLLSLAYFSLISVLAYISLLVLTFTVAFRIYKTVLQAIQKTSDGHPFKVILDIELEISPEKVHEVADLAVANANAAVSELRRLFLVEDFVDSLKFGVLLWSLTYLGSWFNGMTLIIIGVVALFTLPKVYETNKTQIDQNLALVQAKVNEITAKVKAAMPIGKKAEPTKEE